MPHLRIEYTANLDPAIAMGALCSKLAAALAAMLDDAGQALFPLHGTRVLAYPAPHHAAGCGDERNAFIYLNLRLTPGRSPALVDRAGDALLAVVRAHVDGAALPNPMGVTLHIDQLSASYEGRYRPA